MFERLADEQRERAFGGLVFVALVFQFLDAIRGSAFNSGVSFVSLKPSSCAFMTMLLRPARSLMSTLRALPTSDGSMCS